MPTVTACLDYEWALAYHRTMDRTQNSVALARRYEKLQVRMTNEQMELFKKLGTVLESPAAVLKSALDQLKRETGILFDVTQIEINQLAPHLTNYALNCREYLQVKGLPDEFTEFYNRMDGWRKKIETVAGEMKKDGLIEESDALDKMAFQLWKNSFPARHRGMWRKIPGTRATAETARELSRLYHCYKNSREKSEDDHFVVNFAVPARDILGARRNLFFFLAEIYLDLYPSQNRKMLHGKVAMQSTATALTDRVKKFRKQHPLGM